MVSTVVACKAKSVPSSAYIHRHFGGGKVCGEAPRPNLRAPTINVCPPKRHVNSNFPDTCLPRDKKNVSHA